jgi:cellulose synthase (UDP-forming)
MIRRKALDSIGGFPTGTITEDMHTSLRMQKKGWRVLYFNRTMARGLAPQTFTGFATQWQRWGHGAMQVLRQENPFFTKDLSFAQKMCYFSSFYFYWMSWVKVFFVATPIIALFFAVFPLVTTPQEYASNFLPYFVLNLACSVLLQGGIRNFLLSEEFNLLKMHVLMKTISGLFQKETLFFVTPKARAAAARATEVLLPLGLLAALMLALGAGIIRIQKEPVGTYYFWALAVNIFWAVAFMVFMAMVVSRSMKHKEQRAIYRFPTRAELPMRVNYTNPKGQVVSMDQFARNLNRSGVSLTSVDEIAKGTPVQIALQLPSHTVQATGRVVNKQVFKNNGRSEICNGVAFDQIAVADQDEISKYLFWEIAPKEGEVLGLTHRSQHEARVELDQASPNGNQRRAKAMKAGRQ